MDYERCLALQQVLHARVAAGDSTNYVVLVEHPPVLTFGKHADRGHLLFAADFFRSKGVGLVDTDRGGEVTAHEPGQLVAYPILRLGDFNLTPRRYVDRLESSVIAALSGFGIRATRDPDHPGVWVDTDKICAVGVRIKDRVSLHGIALNINNSLDLFQQIVPCGILGRGVTSMSRVLGRPCTVEEVLPSFINELRDSLGVETAAGSLIQGLHWPDGTPILFA